MMMFYLINEFHSSFIHGYHTSEKNLIVALCATQKSMQTDIGNAHGRIPIEIHNTNMDFKYNNI